MLELDVHWSDGADLDKVGVADISVRIDNAPVPHPRPLRSDVGMLYGFELGSFNAILPALSPSTHSSAHVSVRNRRPACQFAAKPLKTGSVSTITYTEELFAIFPA